jgi:formate dehydrogenase subunit delta
MDADNLVRMANRIADFFAAMPDAQEATDGVATHLKKFWEPRMRQQLRRLIDSGRGAGLHPLVLKAAQAGAV